MEEIVVVGAGIGGLCSAVRLLSKGYKVRILEKNHMPGGRVGCIHGKTSGDIFDLTASIIMTPNIYTDVFKCAGKDYKDYFKISFLDINYKVNYYDGSSEIYYKDIGKTLNMLEGRKQGLSMEYMKFLQKSYEKYRLSKDYFLDKSLEQLKDLINCDIIKSAMRICPFRDAANYIDGIVGDEKLKEFLLFQSMYIGVNPYTSSSVYTLIPAITQIYGIGYVEGGMYKYIKSLEKLVYDLGGIIEYDTPVSHIIIDKYKVTAVESSKGQARKCSMVICNCDYSYAIKELLDEKYMKKGEYNVHNIGNKDYSCSVFMLYIGLDKFYKELQVHNIYICKDFKNSLEDAFNGKLGTAMNLYIYCPSVIDTSVSTSYEQILNVMVRVPNLNFEHIVWDISTVNFIKDRILETIKNIKGLGDIESHIVFEDYLTPEQLKETFNIYKGSAFGLSHSLTQSMYFRPHIKSECVEGLYFIGASTHPGNGVSVIIDGSKLVCDMVDKDIKSSQSTINAEEEE